MMAASPRRISLLIAIAAILCVAVFALSGCQLSENKVRIVTDWKGGHATVSVKNISDETFKAGEVKVSGDISRSAENGERVGTIWGVNSSELKPGETQAITLKKDFDRGTEADYPNHAYVPDMMKVSILRSGYL